MGVGGMCVSRGNWIYLVAEGSLGWGAKSCIREENRWWETGGWSWEGLGFVFKRGEPSGKMPGRDGGQEGVASGQRPPRFP